MGVPLIDLSEYSLPFLFFVFCDELTKSQLVHTAAQYRPGQGKVIRDWDNIADIIMQTAVCLG